jgi:hypothetical protein
MKRILFIVSRNQLELRSRLVHESRGANVEIVVDRRFGDRRSNSGAQPLIDRRNADRRTHVNASELDLIGLAVVVLS